MHDMAWRWQKNSDDASDASTAGDEQPIKWVIVANTMGLTPAHILAGRLHSEGIPARAWQEAPSGAFGLTVGILGAGHVAVPEEFVAQAEAILAIEYELEEEAAEDTLPETDEETDTV